MQYVELGRTGIAVSRLAFGAGPVAETMVGDDAARQRELVRSAVDAGINWIDTAAGYGDGRAETAVGNALHDLGIGDKVYVATKVRLKPDQLTDIPAAIKDSVSASLHRLKRNQITLLQLHNSITTRRGDEPDSIAPQDVLAPGGVLEAFEQLQADGITQLIGITAIGQARPLREVVDSGCFQTIQVPYNLVNQTAGLEVCVGSSESNYGNIIRHAADRGMGVLAIRVYAGGALAHRNPSRHTRITKYFPLELFQRDKLRAIMIREIVGNSVDLKELALRFSLSHPNVTSVIVGVSEPLHVDEAVLSLNAGPIPKELLTKLQSIDFN